MVRAVEPVLWETIRDASEEEQVNPLANSYTVMQGISHQALGQAGFEQGSLIQRRRSNVSTACRSSRSTGMLAVGPKESFSTGTTPARAMLRWICPVTRCQSAFRRTSTG